MITSPATPAAAAIVTFLTAVINVLVLFNVWAATPNQVAAVNTAVLAAFSLVATLRAGAQHGGTLTATPKPPNGTGA